MQKKLFLGILIAVGINYPVLCTDSMETDSMETDSIEKVKVVELIRSAVESESLPADSQQKIWTQAYELCAHALSAEKSGQRDHWVDLSGKVERKTSIRNVLTGEITPEYYYNDESPLDN